MSHNLGAVRKELNNMARDARELLHATAGVAEDNVIEARARLAAALGKGRRTWHRVRRATLAGVQDADRTIRKRPYHSLGVALGAGILLGFLASRRF